MVGATNYLNSSSTSSESISQSYNDARLAYDRGRASANVDYKVLEETSALTTTTQKSSNLTAANNINITSNKNLNILSSNLNSGVSNQFQNSSSGQSSGSNSGQSSGSTSLISESGNVNILSLSNTVTTSSETRLGIKTLSAGIGNSHVDTLYAEKDLVDAAKAVADAKNQLNHMETLESRGQASKEAVEGAKINLTIATANLALAEIKLAAAAAKSAASAGSLWTGMYGDLRLSIAGTKTNSNASSSTAVASNINSSGNIIINSGLNLTETDSNLINQIAGNTTINGSSLNSQTGNIEITSRNSTNINASQNIYNQASESKSWNESVTLASSAGSGTGAAIDKAVNAASILIGAGISRSNSDTSSVTYNNSSLIASNGSLKINSLGSSLDVNNPPPDGT